ncbi:MAG TPA: RluA family pseudouridine synthase [Acidimicrobiales bacterium]|jgi:23S rRNA pseudouridine1911/1915/1917 synthase
MTEDWMVPSALDGERLDRAVALLTGLSRRDVNELIDAGRVAVAKRVIALHSRRVRTGERLTVEGEVGPARRAVVEADAAVDIPVVWSDDQVVVVDKPAGLVVHPGAGNRSGTLVHGLVARFPDLAAVGEPDRPGIVHRLDKGTSGLLMVARTATAHAALTRQLAHRQVGREYVVLVTGTVAADAGLIDAPLGRADRDPTRIRVQAGGRQARTGYQVEARYDQPESLTRVRCRLETGRTHQIRVHLASIGHPVVGDDRYAGRAAAGWRPLPPGRPFLHAAVLAFDHPVTGERMSFSSRLPEDLRQVLAEVADTSAR